VRKDPLCPVAAAQLPRASTHANATPPRKAHRAAALPRAPRYGPAHRQPPSSPAPLRIFAE